MSSLTHGSEAAADRAASNGRRRAFGWRLPATLGAWMLLAASLTSPGRAAEPPAGVVLDGVVTVHAVMPGPGGAPVPPPVSAEVTLVATINDFPDDPLQTLTGTTKADGVIVFDGVARPADGSPAVYLAVTASWWETALGSCIELITWYGLVSEVPSAATVDVTVPMTKTSRLACPPETTLRGTILDGTGQPIDVDQARVSVVRPDGGGAVSLPFDVAEDGTYEIALPPWGTADAPVQVTVSVVGRATRQETSPDGCVRTFGQVGSATMTAAMANLEAPPRLDVVTAEALLGEVCGSLETTPPPDAGGGSAPTITLPPTDGPARPGSAGAASLPAILFLLGLFALAAGSLRPASRRRRS